jgi:hypothetical protein
LNTLTQLANQFGSLLSGDRVVLPQGADIL